MKVRPSVKPICEKCKIIKRKGRVMVICGLSTTLENTRGAAGEPPMGGIASCERI